MANEEHVAILKQGADAWNNWSYERWKIFWGSDIEVNFGIADFSGADFSGFDLRDLDIGSTDFSSANLSGANLSGANFEATNFRKANLERVNLSKAELMGATLVDADLRDADLESTGLVMVNLSRASLNGANLSKAYLQKANLSEADLAGTNLNGTEYDDGDERGDGWGCACKRVELSTDQCAVGSGDQSKRSDHVDAERGTVTQHQYDHDRGNRQWQPALEQHQQLSGCGDRCEFCSGVCGDADEPDDGGVDAADCDEQCDGCRPADVSADHLASRDGDQHERGDDVDTG